MDPSVFRGKSAIVTGAASGIGREIARQMARHGARVFLTDVVQTGIDTAAAEIVASGGVAEAIRVDVARRDEVQAVIEHVVAVHGWLDFIFNNAGVAIFGAIEHMTLDDWDRTIDVNLRGVAYGAALAYKQMVRQGHGHIVNTASVAGLVPVPLQVQYCATKHAVVGLSKTLALEAVDHGVHVTVFCPGFVDTGMMENNTLRGELEGADARKLVPVPPLPAERAVQTLLDGVARRREMVIVPFYGRLGWWLERLSPALSQRFHRLTLRELRRRVARAKGVAATR